MSSPSQEFDQLTHTFSTDMKFFDSLMEDPCSEAFIEMCIWDNWLREYLNDIQESLCNTIPGQGDDYRVWVATMIGGIGHAVGTLMYLSARGVIHEAAASGRRALEFLGFVSHLIRNPSKARLLAPDCQDTPQYKTAFLSGPSEQAAELKRRGIKYRFAALSMGPACTKLWEIFSGYSIHGDSLRVMSTGVVFFPTEVSCKLLNRSVEETAKHLVIYKPNVEIVAIELSTLAGEFGVRTDRINRAGACVLVWLNREDPRWTKEVELMRKRLGIAALKRQTIN
jgi:hypothetical protein